MIGLGDNLTIFHLWTVAAVLLGFQMAALAWRLNREVYMEERVGITWLTLADYMVYFSILMLVGGVFVAPIFGGVPFPWAVWLLGLSLVIFAATPPVIAGHYNLYPYKPRTRKPRHRNRTTAQEKRAFCIVSVVVVVYFLAGLGLLIYGEV